MDTEQKVLTVEELAAVTAQITEIHRKMNYLTTLTPEQRTERRNRVTTKALHLLPNRVEAAREARKSRSSSATAAPVIVPAPAPAAGSAETVSIPDAPTTKAA